MILFLCWYTLRQHNRDLCKSCQLLKSDKSLTQSSKNWWLDTSKCFLCSWPALNTLFYCCNWMKPIGFHRLLVNSPTVQPLIQTNSDNIDLTNALKSCSIFYKAYIEACVDDLCNDIWDFYSWSHQKLIQEGVHLFVAFWKYCVRGNKMQPIPPSNFIVWEF